MMDTLIYLGTAVLTVSWSVWTYLSWADHAGLSETSGARFLLIIGPSSFFLLIALSGWEKALFLRLDLIGIAAFDALTLLAWLILLTSRVLKAHNYKKVYIAVITGYLISSLLLASFAHLIKLFPPLLIGLTSLISQGLQLDFYKLAWIGLDPETHETDLVGMLNKILIALLSYVPISLLRAVYLSRQRKKMSEEINTLKDRIKELEERIPAK